MWRTAEDPPPLDTCDVTPVMVAPPPALLLPRPDEPPRRQPRRKGTSLPADVEPPPMPLLRDEPRLLSASREVKAEGAAMR
jgi:hypothetical protein